MFLRTMSRCSDASNQIEASAGPSNARFIAAPSEQGKRDRRGETVGSIAVLKFSSVLFLTFPFVLALPTIVNISTGSSTPLLSCAC